MINNCSILEERICQECNRVFSVNPNNKRDRLRKFCSGTCAKRNIGKRNKGRKHTDEWKQKMSFANSGVNNPFYGRTHTEHSKHMIIDGNSQHHIDRLKDVQLSDTDLEILDGMMLGDGHIDISQSSLSGRFCYGSCFKETILQVQKALSKIDFSPIWTGVDKHSGNSEYFIKSHSYKFFRDHHTRWYNKDKTRCIPYDIRLTPLSYYWWAIGDGKPLKYGLILCTERFSKKDCEFLISKLESFGFSCIYSENTHRIRLRSKSAKAFLMWIRQSVSIGEQYEYKWNQCRKEDAREQD